MNISGLSPASVAWILLGVASLAVALPLFSTLSDGATFFVAHVASGLDIVVFTFAAYLLIPATALLLVFVTRDVVGEKASVALLTGFVTIFIAIWMLSIVKALPAGIAFFISAVIGLVAGWAFYSDRILRPLLILIGQISVLIPLYLLFLTPVNALLVNAASSSATGVSLEGPGNTGAGKKAAPVVVLVLDELPLAALMGSAQEIDSVRFPNFSRLQAMSTWYRNATTASTHTHRAISAILSGKRPDMDTLPVPGQLPQNLFSLLSPTHQVFAIESVSRLCVTEVCEKSEEEFSASFNAMEMYADVRFIWLHSVLPREVAARYLPTLGGKWRGFEDGQMRGSDSNGSALDVAMADGFDAKHKVQWNSFVANMALDGPVLNYLHIGLPHHPWIYLPDGTVYNGRETPAATYTHDWKKRPQLVEQALLRFELQLEYVDAILGEALDALEQSSQFDQTLLIVVSDHGLAIAPDEKRRKPSAHTLADVAGIPMFIKYPGQRESKVDDRPVETIDILPTVAHTLQLPLTEQLDGQALNSGEWKAASRVVFEADESVVDFERSMEIDAATSRFQRVVPAGKTALESWGRGSGGKYFGQSALQVSSTKSALVLELDRPEWYTRIDASSGFLPVRLTGSIPGAPRGSQVYISLNGEVAGGSVTHDKRGSLSVMLHPKAFVTGHNELAAYIALNDSLQEIAIRQPEPVQWDLERTDGVITKVNRANVDSYVLDQSRSGAAAISRDAPLAAVIGKAFNEQNKTTPTHLLLVSDSRIVTTKFRAFYNRKVENVMATALVSAFSVEITPEQVPEGSELSVLALWQDGTFLTIPVKDNASLFE